MPDLTNDALPDALGGSDAETIGILFGYLKHESDGWRLYTGVGRDAYFNIDPARVLHREPHAGGSFLWVADPDRVELVRPADTVAAGFLSPPLGTGGPGRPVLGAPFDLGWLEHGIVGVCLGEENSTRTSRRTTPSKCCGMEVRPFPGSFPGTYESGGIGFTFG